MDLALNNLQRLMCHETKPTNKLNIIQIQQYFKINGKRFSVSLCNKHIKVCFNFQQELVIWYQENRISNSLFLYLIFKRENEHVKIVFDFII